MPQVPSHIFRAYDIRGVAEKDVTEELCMLVGKAFGSELIERYEKDNPTVIVGRDARTHSGALEKALIEGLVSTGCHVKTIGQVPSPVNYFALCHFGCDGSVQVTASHNPGEDNGLKLQVRGAEAFAGEELQKLRERIEQGKGERGKGKGEIVDAISPYKEKLKSLSLIPYPLSPIPSKLVVDYGNGVAGPLYGSILKELGFDLIELYADPDGTFPNHIADPTKHDTLTDLIETVRKEEAACGIAFDGDGDRVGFVDETGAVVSPDYLLLLLAEDHLKRNKGASVIYTVSMSGILETEIKRLGGNPVMTVVGHSFVEHAMRKHNAHLGGEQSGHFFCGEDYYDFDDALVAALRVLSVFNNKRKPRKPRSPKSPKSEKIESSASSLNFSNLFKQYPLVYQTPEWRPHCDDSKKEKLIERITKHFTNSGYPTITIDGVRIDFGCGAWVGIRKSNTSPKISICMEARSREKLAEIEAIIKNHIITYAEIDS